MKTFRQFAITALVTIGAFGSVLYVGCKDKCGGIVCQNGGSCSENLCLCPTGYSGNNCGTSWTTEYVGTYNCTQGGSTGWQSSVTVSVNNSGYTVTINQFGGPDGPSVDCIVDSVNHITVVPPAAGTEGISSTVGLYTTPASYPWGVITLTYTIATFNGANETHNTMVMEKQH